MSTTERPRIGLLLGDPAGIGPEVLIKMLADPVNRTLADIVVIGDSTVWQAGLNAAPLDIPFHTVTELTSEWNRKVDAGNNSITLYHALDVDLTDLPRGIASAEAGRYTLDSSRIALEVAQTGLIDGICFAPFNKQAMHLAGSPFEDDLRYFAHVLEFEEYVGELNVMDDLWSARVTSHVPLKEVSNHITEENIGNAVRLADQSLRRAGIEHPRIAVAALNPHAGEGGLFGMEEIEVIQPTVERIAAEITTSTISGPYPSDTVFLKARDGAFDSVVTMYHDQGQVAMKLMGFSKGVTVHGGLSVVVTTPAHGTAFDIVGQGKADAGAMTQAFRLACRMTGGNTAIQELQ